MTWGIEAATMAIAIIMKLFCWLADTITEANCIYYIVVAVLCSITCKAFQVHLKYQFKKKLPLIDLRYVYI